MATIIYILFLITSFIFAQPQYSVEGSIKGMIVDSLTDKPVGYATITLLQSDNNSFISGTVSNEDGFFILEEIKPGKYNIKIQLVGYETLFLDNQLIVPPNMKKNLETIILDQKILDMEGVVVEEDKIFMEEKIDKKVYYVEEMGLATSGTADDVLENIPSVRVDNDGNITLRGNSSVNIMIDGRMTGKNNLDILDAALVKEVEVITLPSAKYDPDGMAGIINVVTKRNEYVGKSGKLSIGTGEWGTRTFSGNANYLKDNLNLFANYSRGDRVNKRGGKIYSTIKNSDQILIEEIINSTSRVIDNNNQNLTFGGEYFLNDLNTLVWDMKYIDYVKDKKINTTVTENYDDVNISDIDNVIYKTDSRQNGYEHNSMFGFYKEFDNDTQKFSIELYKNNENDKELDIIGRGNFSTIERNESDQSTFKIDYTHPLNSTLEGKSNILEFGLQDKLYTDNTIFNFNDDYNLNFNYQRNIMSMYFDMTYYMNNMVTVLFGTRIERASRTFSTLNNNNIVVNDIFTYLINETANQSIDKLYTKAYPSLFFQLDLKKKGTIKLGASKRVERPGTWALSPIPSNFSNPKSIRVGNPLLKPEDILKVELSYSNRLSFGYLSTTIYNDIVKNQFDYDNDDVEFEEQIYKVLSYNNIGEAYTSGIDMFLMTRPLKFWDLKISLEYNENTVKKSSEFDQVGTEYYFTSWIGSTFKIRDDIKLDISTWMWQKNLTTGKIHPMSGTSVSLRKDFEKKSSLVFKINDLFEQTKFSLTTNYQNPESFNYHYYNRDGEAFRKYSLTFEYKFGEYKAKKFDRGSSDQEYEGGMGY